MLDVKDFGAVGDGIKDDGDAISAAIKAAGGIEKVYFPEGVYRLTEPLKW